MFLVNLSVGETLSYGESRMKFLRLAVSSTVLMKLLNLIERSIQTAFSHLLRTFSNASYSVSHLLSLLERSKNASVQSEHPGQCPLEAHWNTELLSQADQNF